MTASFKGGVGKSAMAACLARYIADSSKTAKVGMVDWDVSEAVTAFIERHGHESLFLLNEANSEAWESTTHHVIDTVGSLQGLDDIHDKLDHLNGIVVISDTGERSIAAAGKMLEELKELNYPAKKTFVLINRVNKASLDKYYIPHEVIPSIIESFPKVRVITTYIPEAIGIKYSIELDKGVRALSPTARTALEGAFDEILHLIK